MRAIESPAPAGGGGKGDIAPASLVAKLPAVASKLGWRKGSGGVPAPVGGEGGGRGGTGSVDENGDDRAGSASSASIRGDAPGGSPESRARAPATRPGVAADLFGHGGGRNGSNRDNGGNGPNGQSAVPPPPSPGHKALVEEAGRAVRGRREDGVKGWGAGGAQALGQASGCHDTGENASRERMSERVSEHASRPGRAGGGGGSLNEGRDDVVGVGSGALGTGAGHGGDRGGAGEKRRVTLAELGLLDSSPSHLSKGVGLLFGDDEDDTVGDGLDWLSASRK